MKISTYSQNNNMSFGVRMDIRETKVGALKRNAAKMPKTNVVCQKIHMLIAEHIENTTNDSLSVSDCFGNIKKRTEPTRENLDFLTALINSGKTIAQAFYETCDKLFDTQLIKKDIEDNQNVENILKKKRRIYINSADRKKIIDSCINHGRPSKSNRDNNKDIDGAYHELRDFENINCSPSTISDYMYAIFKIPKYYKTFISQTTDQKTFKNFQEYIKKENKQFTYRAIYNNFELFKYTVNQYNNKFPEVALKFEEEEKNNFC